MTETSEQNDEREDLGTSYGKKGYEQFSVLNPVFFFLGEYETFEMKCNTLHQSPLLKVSTGIVQFCYWINKRVPDKRVDVNT